MSAELVHFLSSTELLEGASDAVIQSLAQRAILSQRRRGETLFEQGAPANELHFLVDGRVEIRRNDPWTGHEFLLAQYGPGKSLGEENALLDELCMQTATISEDARVVSFDAAVSRWIVTQVPEAAAACARILARRASRLLSEKGVRFVVLNRLPMDPGAAELLPLRVATEHRAVPIVRRGSVVTVGMVNPHDVVAATELRRHFKDAYVEILAISQSDFEARIARLAQAAPEATADPNVLPRMPQRPHNLVYQADDVGVREEEKARADVGGEQVIALLNQLLGDALLLDTSDIHIEPGPEGVLVRYRIDGRLLRRPDPIALRFHVGLITRLKALAQMNITERRRPQDGRLSVQLGAREVALRISTVPTRFGEKAVLRVLDRNAGLMNLERIVTIPSAREAVRSLVNQPHGLLLVTGPTGSGKTTTMYSAILERKGEGVNIVTIEDPIEYTIPGITQVQRNEGAGLDYPEAIKSFLRQDPDIMLIGETRDGRTAQNAMLAALSGHLVVTSFHTNSALGTVYRLKEMGIELFLIGNAVCGIIAQRLVRTICGDCREPTDAPEELLARIYPKGTERPPLFRGRGCQRCGGTGYRGRTAVLEVLPMNEELRHAISINATMAELRRIAVQGGMITFRDYARALLLRGVTTPQEILRVLYSNEDGMQTSGGAVRCEACGTMNDPSHRFCEECGSAMPGHEHGAA